MIHVFAPHLKAGTVLRYGLFVWAASWCMLPEASAAQHLGFSIGLFFPALAAGVVASILSRRYFDSLARVTPMTGRYLGLSWIALCAVLDLALAEVLRTFGLRTDALTERLYLSYLTVALVTWGISSLERYRMGTPEAE